MQWRQRATVACAQAGKSLPKTEFLAITAPEFCKISDFRMPSCQRRDTRHFQTCGIAQATWREGEFRRCGEDFVVQIQKQKKLQDRRFQAAPELSQAPIDAAVRS
jgi:hypothetical protein